MSYHLGTNAWAPKLIIIFQLATWSIIGFILIEKGTIYLRVKEQKYQQNTIKRNIPAPASDRDSTLESTRESEPGTSTTFGITRDKSTEIWPSEIGDMRELRRKTASRENRRRRFDVLGDRVVGRNEKIEKIVAVRKQSRQENIGYTFSSHPNNFTAEYAGEAEEKIRTTDSDKIVLVAEQNKRNNESGGASANEKDASGGSNHLGNSQRHSTVNSAGAAAALVMLSIGVIMVLLGPAIVILRAFDARRQQRTLSLTTSSADKDLPPSYEQATLMDQAPRYSTLRLNAIPETFPLQSSSSSTTFH